MDAEKSGRISAQVYTNARSEDVVPAEPVSGETSTYSTTSASAQLCSIIGTTISDMLLIASLSHRPLQGYMSSFTTASYCAANACLASV
jgi:hypothetical protein